MVRICENYLYTSLHSFVDDQVYNAVCTYLGLRWSGTMTRQSQNAFIMGSTSLLLLPKRLGRTVPPFPDWESCESHGSCMFLLDAWVCSMVLLLRFPGFLVPLGAPLWVEWWGQDLSQEMAKSGCTAWILSGGLLCVNLWGRLTMKNNGLMMVYERLMMVYDVYIILWHLMVINCSGQPTIATKDGMKTKQSQRCERIINEVGMTDYHRLQKGQLGIPTSIPAILCQQVTSLDAAVSRCVTCW